jgi:hypothetical protein
MLLFSVRGGRDCNLVTLTLYLSKRHHMNKKQNESINPIVPETKSISGGLAAVKARFMELGRSYERHLAIKDGELNLKKINKT